MKKIKGVLELLAKREMYFHIFVKWVGS